MSKLDHSVWVEMHTGAPNLATHTQQACYVKLSEASLKLTLCCPLLDMWHILREQIGPWISFIL